MRRCRSGPLGILSFVTACAAVVGSLSWSPGLDLIEKVESTRPTLAYWLTLLQLLLVASMAVGPIVGLLSLFERDRQRWLGVAGLSIHAFLWWDMSLGFHWLGR